MNRELRTRIRRVRQHEVGKDRGWGGGCSVELEEVWWEGKSE
jgi:hypothetical protein